MTNAQSHQQDYESGQDNNFGSSKNDKNIKNMVTEDDKTSRKSGKTNKTRVTYKESFNTIRILHQNVEKSFDQI